MQTIPIPTELPCAYTPKKKLFGPTPQECPAITDGPIWADLHARVCHPELFTKWEPNATWALCGSCGESIPPRMGQLKKGNGVWRVCHERCWPQGWPPPGDYWVDGTTITQAPGFDRSLWWTRVDWEVARLELGIQTGNCILCDRYDSQVMQSGVCRGCWSV
jgi:hypothetical protein